MKKATILFLFFIITLFSNAQTTASVMLLSGEDFYNALNSHASGVLILRVITNGTNVHPTGFIFDRTARPKFSIISLTPVTSIPFQATDYPFDISTLRWAIDEDADAGFLVDRTSNYLLFPQVDNKKHLVYYFEEEQIILKNAGVNTLLDFKNLGINKIREVLIKSSNSGGTFNPIPPRLVP